MSNYDERRSIAGIEKAKRRRYLADVDKLIVNYEGLASRDHNRNRELQELRVQLRKANELASQHREEARRLAAQNARLKIVSDQLRNSSSLKVGKALMLPWRAAKRAARELAENRESRAAPARAAPEPSAPKSIMPSVASADRAIVHLDDSTDHKLTQLEAAAESSMTAQNVYKLASFRYFGLGQLVEPAKLLREHADILAVLTLQQRRTAASIRGLQRTFQEGIFLPKRQPNPGYVVEPERIMYCVHSTDPFNSNGYSTRTNGLTKGLKEAGADFIVAARPGYPWDVKTDVPASGKISFEQEIHGVRHIFSSGASWTAQPFDHYVQIAADQFVQTAIQNRVAVIQAASNHVTALPALIAARRLGLPFVYEVRGFWEITELSSKPGWEQTERFKLAVNLETQVAQGADRVLAITPQVAAELIRRGVRKERISLLPNSVDVTEFAPLPPHKPTRERLGLSPEIPVIGYAGSIVEYEGLDLVLKATRRLIDGGLEVRTVIVGDGPALAELKDLSRQLDLGQYVTFTGRVTAADIPLYMSCFDVMPCPRRKLPVTDMVSPLKPLEAMAAGKVVVLSDLPPLRDLAGSDGERGYLCEPDDDASLANALKRAITERTDAGVIGRRARLWTVRERTWLLAGQAVRSVLASVNTANPSGQHLDTLTIGIIADRFTTAGLDPEVSLVELRPDQWAEQLRAQPIDALFVESAWEGVGGLWRGKVGFYGEESFADLKALISACRRRKIPTIFWNKEDPVHFNRFRVTAKYFDHVLTTDDGCIPKYLAHRGAHLKSVAALPFYAQPLLHNPLSSTRSYSHTVSYAGSYYGNRYKDRSAQLERLLDAALPQGLTIYDRQHLNPESPYNFPDRLASYVAGGLEYEDMVQAYKSHPVHLNVNSVEQSNTMFSRRVMEIAACGGAIVSGPGRGVERVLCGTVPIVSDRATAALLMELWMSDEAARLEDAWLAMRTVFRSNTAGHRLAYALRVAGIEVRAPELEKYVVSVERLTDVVAQRLASQSVPPTAVFCAVDERAVSPALPFSVRQIELDTLEDQLAAGERLVATLADGEFDRTYFEDLLTSRKYSDWTRASISSDELDRRGLGMVREIAANTRDTHPVMSVKGTSGTSHLGMRRQLHPWTGAGDVEKVSTARVGDLEVKNILVAGHDLKFASGILRELERRGHTVLIDQWTDHNKHDETRSQELLRQADIIFCEWTLGNAVWYSQRKLPHQRLVTRFHSQELFTVYPESVAFSAVDEVIFVGEHIRSIAVRDYVLSPAQTLVVANAVDVGSLSQPKADDARFNIGLVGIIPQQKGLDRALDVLMALRQTDERFHLYVKGKRPEDYPWMAKRIAEMDFYNVQFERIEREPLLQGAVTFDPHGDDMPAWYSKIGFVLSVSDFESFHLTLADGAASGAIPVALAWPGADQIYPTDWLNASLYDMNKSLVEYTRDADVLLAKKRANQSFVDTQFAASKITPLLVDTIMGNYP